MYDLIIIGGGVTGLGAAVYAARFNLKTLILAKRKGGLIQDTHLVENYPGIKRMSGLEMVQKFEEHVKDYEVEYLEDALVKAKIKGEKDKCTYLVKTENGKEYESKTLLFATGTKRKKLDIPGEKEFTNKGVSYCATCDAPLFKNKVVGVVGGSDSAAKEALLLAEYAREVYIIYRGEKIRAEPINLKRVEQNRKIKVITNTNVTEVKGETMLKKAIFDKKYNGKKELELEGLFIEIGHIVESEIAKTLNVKVNEKNEIIIDTDSKTNVKGVYAAGDVTNREFKQAITGVAEGVIAAFSAYTYIKSGECPY